MKEETKNRLIQIAKRNPANSDPEFDPYDYSGGNFDDAYSMGCTDGEIDLARLILSLEGVDWTV